MNGEVGVLNVGAGDTKLLFNSDNPRDVERARAIVQDMLANGYALLVQVGENAGEPVYQRAHAFDPETDEYIIMGGPDDEVVDIGAESPVRKKKTKKKSRAKKKTKRVPAKKTSAVSVPRTSGG